MKDQITKWKIETIKNEGSNYKVKNRKVNKSNAFSLYDDVLMYADRVVIPTSWQKHILKEFHVGHPVFLQWNSLMRCYKYWLKMDEDVQNMVK